MGHYGIGELTAVTILAELGDARRFSSSRDAVRYAGLDITVHQSDQRRAARPPLAPRTAGAALGALRGRPVRRAGPAAPTATTTTRPPSGSAATAPAWRSRASCSSAATTRCASSARRPCSPPDDASVRAAALSHTDAPRPAPRMLLPPRTAWTASKDRAAATHTPAGSPHQPSCRRPAARRVADRDKAGRPRAPTPPLHRAHARPDTAASPQPNTIARLTREPAQIRSTGARP